MPRFIRAPKGRARQVEGAEHHPWAMLTGSIIGCASCSHCGSALVAKAVIDDDGKVWGVDCYASAHPEWKAPKARKTNSNQEEASLLRRIAKIEARFPGSIAKARSGQRDDRASRTIARDLETLAIIAAV